MSARGRLALVVALVAVASAAEAGGPLVTTTDGHAAGWAAGAPVEYHTDLGGLGSLANGAAVATVVGLFDTWTAVPSAVVSFAHTGSTAVDIDETNFGPFLGPYGGATAPLGESVIAFDEDGAIFDALYGVGSGVLGFAGPAWLSDGVSTVPIGAAVPPGAKIVEGLAFLNGKWIDGIDNPSIGNYELSLDDFEAVFVHEFGHFAGLDHTQAHGQPMPPNSDTPGVTLPIETMYPFLFDARQKTLERDDVVALSVLYPSPVFESSTGRIIGRVLTSSGVPLSGANVVARNIDDASDAVSYVSGATIVPRGTYTLAGLTPGASYRVEVQEVDAAHTGGSRVGPFSPPIVLPGPPEAYNGPAESADPGVDDPSLATPIVAAAGVTTSGIDIVLNYQDFAVRNVPLEEGSQLQSFALDDFDGDAVTDFVAPQYGFVPGNMTRFYHGVGDGLFDAPVTIQSFPGNASAVAGQFNPGVDAFPDVAVLGSTLLEIRVYFGDGAGGFAAPVTIFDLPNPGFSKYTLGLVGGDVNGDGWTDLLTLVGDPADDSATAHALLGSAGGAFSIVSTPFASGSPFPRGGSLRLAQLTGGPALDLVGNLSDTALGLLTGDGAGGFTASAISLGAVTTRLGGGLDVGDFDEDGRTDLVVSDLHPVGGPTNFTRSFVDVLLGDGSGGFTLSAQYPVPEVFQFAVDAAYVDGDAHLDVASAGPGIGPGAKMNVALGDGTGGMSAASSLWGLPESPMLLTAAELNDDGRTDFLVGSTASVYSVLLQEHCGNGAVEAPEQCDDGNRTNSDGCDGNCTFTACGNGVVSAGEQCDDGNTLSGDGCSSSCIIGVAVCGDTVVTAPEQCDDGNLDDGDCCSSSCTFDAPGSACVAPANLCLTAACDGGGTCQLGPRPPRPGCRQSTAMRAGSLQLIDRGDDRKDRLAWKWGKGVTTPKAAFGDPTTTTGYGFCLYDAGDQLIMSARIPAGVHWKGVASGFRYADRDLSADGVSRIVLGQGLQDGKAKVSVGGKGTGLAMPVLPIAPAALPLRAQLEAANGECWVATYGGFVSTNAAEKFSARSD